MQRVCKEYRMCIKDANLSCLSRLQSVFKGWIVFRKNAKSVWSINSIYEGCRVFVIKKDAKCLDGTVFHKDAEWYTLDSVYARWFWTVIKWEKWEVSLNILNLHKKLPPNTQKGSHAASARFCRVFLPAGASLEFVCKSRAHVSECMHESVPVQMLQQRFQGRPVYFWQTLDKRGVLLHSLPRVLFI